jgi:hypothetical protein
MFKSRSKVLFVSSLLISAYVIYLMYYFGSSMFVSDGTEALGGAIATALVTPHMLVLGLGAVFSWIGFFFKKSWAALVAAILYCAGAILFLMYALFVVPSIILGFIGYAKQKHINQSNN